jgi:plastocyanin
MGAEARRARAEPGREEFARMRHRRISLGLLGAVTLLGGLLLPATTAAAATTYDVGVGQFLHNVPAESMRYFPSTVDVHQGDTLHFVSDGFHTATALPVGQGPVAWFDANASGPDAPYSIIQSDTDDGPTSTKFSTAVALPSDPTCGAAATPCSYGGSGLVNSGVPISGPMDFSIGVDASAGSTFYVVCLIHGPSMRLKVNVVAAGESASDQTDLDAANAAALDQDQNSAEALWGRYANRQTWHRTPDGTKVWDAWAGVDNRHVALYGMFPLALKIDKGDRVQWHFDNLEYEVHTVTFPIGTARDIVKNSFIPVCDTGPGGDSPPDLEGPPFCSDPTQLEIQLDDRHTLPMGNGVFKRNDLESSGVRGVTSYLGDANYELRFAKRSTDGPFKYICLIHPFMRGKVIVK